MGNFTAGMLKDNKYYVEEQVNNNQGFYFMNQIKETPAYWKSFSMKFLR